MSIRLGSMVVQLHDMATLRAPSMPVPASGMGTMLLEASSEFQQPSGYGEGFCHGEEESHGVHNRACRPGRQSEHRKSNTEVEVGPTGQVPDRADTAQERWTGVAKEVREAFLHAWRGYQRHAWGADELRPVSGQGRNSFGQIGLTIIDSLTTLHLMDLPEEFERATAYVEKELRFGLGDAWASVFELTIRALGGLLGAHSLTGKQVFLDRARELAEQLLPAFNTTSQLPLSQWNLHRAEGDKGSMPSVLAEAGSIQLEWRYLAQQTGDARFEEVADAAFEAIQATGIRGLLPALLSAPSASPPRLVSSKFTLGGQCDSYYEYLLKQWLLGGKRDAKFKELFLGFMAELPALVRPAPSRGAARPLRLLEADAHGRVVWKMEHLSCFVPGMIALAQLTLPPEDVAQHQWQWESMAEGLTASCVEMWTSTKSGLAPEHAHVSSLPPHDWLEVPAAGKHSLLRPETVESLYYMFRLTGNSRYREWGEQIFRAIVAHSRTEVGYSSVVDVNSVPTRKDDTMHSFVLAETFKYLYLLFAEPGLVDLDEYVFNTEGHPLRKARQAS